MVGDIEGFAPGEERPCMFELGLRRPWVRMQSQVDLTRPSVAGIAHFGAELETHQAKLLYYAQNSRSFDLHLVASPDVHLLKGASSNVGKISAADAREERAPLAGRFAPRLLGRSTLLRHLSTPGFAFAFALAPSAEGAPENRVVRKVFLDGWVVFIFLPS